MWRNVSVLFAVLILFIGISGVHSSTVTNNDLNGDMSFLSGSGSVLLGGGVYVGNAGTHKFHTNGCSYGKKIKHKIYFNSRAEAIKNGYTPCKHCHP